MINKEEIEVVKLFAEYGVLGLVVLALFAFIFFAAKNYQELMRQMHKDHKEERKEWRESFDDRSEELNRSLQDLIREVTRSK